MWSSVTFDLSSCAGIGIEMQEKQICVNCSENQIAVSHWLLCKTGFMNSFTSCKNLGVVLLIECDNLFKNGFSQTLNWLTIL